MNEDRYMTVNQAGLELVFDGDPGWYCISNHIDTKIRFRYWRSST